MKIIKMNKRRLFFLLFFSTLTVSSINGIYCYLFPEMSLSDLPYALKELDLTLLSIYWKQIAVLIVSLFMLTIAVSKWDYFGIIVLLCCLCFTIYRNQSQLSTSTGEEFFERHYIIPTLYLPKRPKNIIYISAESVEETYADQKYWGRNYIPYLTKLKQKGTSFSGYYLLPRTETTIRAIGGFFCGIPGILGSEAKEKFLPGAICISDLLHSKGYYTVFIKAGLLSFAKTNLFVRDHNFDEAYGTEELFKENLITDSDRVISGGMKGIPDSVLFRIAQKKLTDLSNHGQPFFLSLFTLNTHVPSGYLEPNCPAMHDGDMRDTIACTDKIIYDFVRWCQQQEFYKDTVIFIVGDHLVKQGLMTEYPEVKEKLTLYPNREIYNVILDGTGEIKPQIIKKQFTQMDWMPTILESVGFFLPNRQYAMGVSLFSRNNKTLVERYGKDGLNNLIQYDFATYKKVFIEGN